MPRTLSTLGNAHNEADEEDAKGDEQLREEGLDMRILNVRPRVRGEAGRSAHDNEDEHGHDDGRDGLRDGAREENQSGCLASEGFAGCHSSGPDTHAEGEERRGARDLGRLGRGDVVLPSYLQ